MLLSPESFLLKKSAFLKHILNYDMRYAQKA